MDFEWDDAKAEWNVRKHGIRFTEAITIWFDENALELFDLDHGRQEERWVRLGFSRVARLLVVVYVEKVEGERIRIISARNATAAEAKYYSGRSL